MDPGGVVCVLSVTPGCLRSTGVLWISAAVRRFSVGVTGTTLSWRDGNVPRAVPLFRALSSLATRGVVVWTVVRGVFSRFEAAPGKPEARGSRAVTLSVIDRVGASRTTVVRGAFTARTCAGAPLLSTTARGAV